MKKLLLIAALLPFAAISQPTSLDTVYVRNLSLQAQDWLWLSGKYTQRSDSLTLKGFRKLRQVAQTLQPPVSMTTSVNVDSLPGRVVVEMYRIIKMAAGGENTSRYTAITNAITAKTVLSGWVAFIDAALAGDRAATIALGKYDVLDQ